MTCGWDSLDGGLRRAGRDDRDTGTRIRSGSFLAFLLFLNLFPFPATRRFVVTAPTAIRTISIYCIEDLLQHFVLAFADSFGVPHQVQPELLTARLI